MSDAEAMEWLDRLLSAEAPQRQASLAQLATSNPALHARLERLLAGALSAEQSRVLFMPVLDGVRQLSTDLVRKLQPGDVLAGYRLIREIGRGGMAVVWLAERADGVVRRTVALKMPLFSLHGVGEAERFVRERDVLAALSHPHVARLYDAGVLPSGQPFIILEHVDGVPLTVFCDANRLDIRARLRLFLQVLAAVEHAHKHLVVHRDLKPSNILVDEEGQVKLLDFGVAKLLGENESNGPLTQAAGAPMTPLYAAPEQLRGGAISTLTDVFALGVVLFELLTGGLPYRGKEGGRANLADVLEALDRGNLPRASELSIDDASAIARGLASAARLRRELSGDLDTIIGKAMRVASQDRYGSAAHIAEDLCRFLDKRPIAARPLAFWYRIELAVKRHRLASAVAAAGLVLVGVASNIAWQQNLDSRAHAKRTAAVRDFMFELVNDAEPAEGQEGEITGRQMVDGAVIRARRDFGEQPQLQGELLGELGRMYIRLDASDAAVPVLREAVDTLQRHAAADDAALNKSRAFLADALVQTGGDAMEIRTLASSARAACNTQDIECAKARAYGGNILGQIESREGNTERARADMRQSATDMVLGFGEKNVESAMAFLHLAIIARNSGRIEEAGNAVRQALVSAEGQRLRVADHLVLQTTMAVVDTDLGNYQAALTRLRGLLDQPASDSERALQQRLIASVAAEQGDGEAAVTASAAALTLLASGTGPHVLFARQAHARGLSLQGEYTAALAEFDQVIQGLAAEGRPPDGFEVLRARRYRAETLLRARRDEEALRDLREIRSLHEKRKPSAVELGLVLELLGEAALRAGDPQESRAAHEAAGVEFRSQLPEGHPYLIKNAGFRRVMENNSN